MTEISIKFPDGASREYSAGISGADLARDISSSLGKRAVAMLVDGELRDLADGLNKSARVEIITREHVRALELIRHDCAHVMAEAVQELWPQTKVTIGPVIENGFYYDFDSEHVFTPQDLPVIEKKMHEIIARNNLFEKKIVSRNEATDLFKKMNEPYKVELLDAIPQGEDIKLYSQGEWIDLCRGPHMPSTKFIGKAFKLMNVAGAYWRGSSKNKMLTRIYATAWENEKQLQNYLHMLEEAQKRDHRKLGKEMNLFHFEEAGPGVVFWHGRGWQLFQNLVGYMRRRINEPKHAYEEISTPQILDRSMWETSGHWGWYKENMFTTSTLDEREFAIKPMNCPGHVLIFKNSLRSYKELPVKLAEFGTVHRYEPSGALHGLMRVRGFTQDDAHVLCTPEQLEAECLRINELVLSTYADFGFEEILIKLSTRPEKRVGSDENWDRSEKIMGDVLTKIAKQGGGKITTQINEGEGAFYGPKYEYVLKDALGRHWQCGTTQVDFALPERFGASYVDENSSKQEAVMIHRAICGSMERFIGILLEHYAGRLPLWISPVHMVVAAITSDADSYAKKVADEFKAAGLNVNLDLRNEKINYKVREHSLAKVPLIVAVGEREAKGNEISLRRLGNNEQKVMPLQDAVEQLKKEILPPDVLRVAAPDVLRVAAPDVLRGSNEF